MIISILYTDITQYHIEVYDIKLYDTILSFIIWKSFVLSTRVLIDIDHTLQYEFEYIINSKMIQYWYMRYKTMLCQTTH